MKSSKLTWAAMVVGGVCLGLATAHGVSISLPPNLTLSGDMTIDGASTWSSGNLDLAGYTLTQTSTGTMSYSTFGWLSSSAGVFQNEGLLQMTNWMVVDGTTVRIADGTVRVPASSDARFMGSWGSHAKVTSVDKDGNLRSMNVDVAASGKLYIESNSLPIRLGTVAVGAGGLLTFDGPILSSVSDIDVDGSIGIAGWGITAASDLNFKRGPVTATGVIDTNGYNVTFRDPSSISQNIDGNGTATPGVLRNTSTLTQASNLWLTGGVVLDNQGTLVMKEMWIDTNSIVRFGNGTLQVPNSGTGAFYGTWGNRREVTTRDQGGTLQSGSIAVGQNATLRLESNWSDVKLSSVSVGTGGTLTLDGVTLYGDGSKTIDVVGGGTIAVSGVGIKLGDDLTIDGGPVAVAANAHLDTNGKILTLGPDTTTTINGQVYLAKNGGSTVNQGTMNVKGTVGALYAKAAAGGVTFDNQGRWNGSRGAAP